MKPEIECPFGKLPCEIKRKIFGYLNLKDKKACRRVCPNWRIIIDGDMMFKAILNNKTKEWLLHSTYTPEVITIKNLTRQNKQFNFEAHHDTLTVTRGYSIGSGVSEKCILDFFRYVNTNITAMELKTLSLAHVHPSNLRRIQPFLKWPDLTSLYISVGCERGIKIGSSERYVIHLKTLLEFLRTTKFPALKAFGVSLHLQHEWFKPVNKTEKMVPYKGIFEFVSKHVLTLRNLDITIQTDFEQPFQNGNFIKKLCSKLSLIAFASFFDPNNQALFGYIFSGLKKLKMLKHLDYNLFNATPSQQNMLSDVIKGSIGKNLEAFVLHKLNHFDLSCLVKCKKLIDLEILLVSPENVRVSPKLTSLMRLCVTCFFGPYHQSCYQYVSTLSKGMANLEILEAIFHGIHSAFTFSNVENIISGHPHLYKLILFPVSKDAVERLSFHVPGIQAGYIAAQELCPYFRIFVDRATYVRGVYN